MDGLARAIGIVIADDHALFRAGLRLLLESESDLRVLGEAADGDETLDVVGAVRPDILLLDLMMRRRPGLDVLRALGETGTPVRTILLTASIDNAQMIEALQLGAQGVVLKDSATPLLFKSIRAVQTGEYWVGRERVTNLVHYLRSLATASTAEAARKPKFGLSNRELQIVSAIVGGYTNKEIAQRFTLSEDTVKHHLTNIFDKCGLSNRLELALFALNHHLVDGQ